MSLTAAPVPKFAPDFALPDGSRASKWRGQPLIVAFAPDEWNPARAQQSELWQKLAAQFGALSLDTTTDEWHAFDNNGAVAAQFGVRGERAVFVIDENGKIVWNWSSESEEVAPGEVLAALESLQNSQPKSGLSRRSFITVRPSRLSSPILTSARVMRHRSSSGFAARNDASRRAYD